MSKRTHVVLEDDIDGSEASETLAFTIDGVSYEIDLNAENAAALREAIAPWVGHARRTSGSRRTRHHASQSGPSASDIRAWAQAQGLEVSARGRVSAEVREAYEKAH